MKRHPQYKTFIMGRISGLSCEVRTARKHLKTTGRSYAKAARIVGVSVDMMKMVLTGRRVSRRVLDGVMAIPTPGERLAGFNLPKLSDLFSKSLKKRGGVE